jgi:3-hydroxybutyryl-CoA dehydrogenase
LSLERIGIVGSGTIACGLAATVAVHSTVVIWARSRSSAERAEHQLAKLRAKLSDANHWPIEITTGLDGIEERTFVVEAVAEDRDTKREVLTRVATRIDRDAVLATTTSSLSVSDLAQVCGCQERFVGLHVFNPVPRMKLVELIFPEAASGDTRARARALCLSLDKHPVEVPDTAGFVVNRLLFPFLFDAVRYVEDSALDGKDVDACMTLGAGHPMGPLALLDFVGLDVAAAIGDALGIEVPPIIRHLVSDGALGRKAGRGLSSYLEDRASAQRGEVHSAAVL